MKLKVLGVVLGLVASSAFAMSDERIELQQVRIVSSVTNTMLTEGGDYIQLYANAQPVVFINGVFLNTKGCTFEDFGDAGDYDARWVCDSKNMHKVYDLSLQGEAGKFTLRKLYQSKAADKFEHESTTTGTFTPR